MCKISKFYRVLMVIIIIVFWMGIVRGEGVNQVITFNNNVQIDGVYGEYTTSFLFNDTISEFEDGKVILYYSVSDLLLHKSSNITFMLNGVKFHTIKISLGGIDKEKVVVDIPRRLVNDGYNELKLIVLHRTIDGDICFDDINPGNWVVFHKDSYVDIVLDYRDNSYIKDYPYPYIGVSNNVPDTVNIILQEEASKEELTAYINLCADLGRRDKNEVLDIVVVRESDLDKVKGNAVYIGNYEGVGGEIKALLDKEDMAVLKENSIIKRVKSPYNKGTYLLLLISNRPEGMVDVIDFMLDDKLLSQVKGNKVVIIDKIQDEGIKRQPSAFTLADVGYGDVFREGLFQKNTSYSISIPENLRLKRGSRFYVRCRHSNAIDVETSTVTLFVNSIPMDSKQLIKSGDESNVYQFNIDPMALGDVNNLDLRLEFFFNPDFDKCEPGNQNGIWFFIAKESYLDLIFDDKKNYNLSDFRGAFIKEDILRDTTIVAKNVDDENVLRGIGRLSLYLGKNATGIHSYKVDDDVKSDSNNYIILDIDKSDAFVRTHTNLLPISYNYIDKRYKGKDTNLDDLMNYNQDMTLVQMIKSPLDETKTIMILAGKSVDTVSSAIKLIADSELNTSLDGEALLISDDGDVFLYESEDEEKDRIRKFISNTKPSRETIKTITIIGVILIMLVLGAIFIIRSR